MTETHDAGEWHTGGPPEVAVVVSTFGRAGFLPELFRSLEAQTFPAARFEVVVVDNGSRDRTWEALREEVARSPIRLRVAHVAENRGAAGGRNAGVALSHAPLLAFTDDDCLPEAEWLSALVSAATDADVVQGRTLPVEPRPPDAGPWWRSIWVEGVTGLYDTCNIAYRRARFEEAGGFDEDDPLTGRVGGRAYGEDALLGAHVRTAGGSVVYAPDAIVRHRWLPGTYRRWLSERRNLEGFPALVRRSPAVASGLIWSGCFLTRRTAAFDLALAGTALAATTRRPSWLLATVPWVRMALPQARWRRSAGRPTTVRLAQVAVADAVGLFWLLRGSARYRRLLL